MICIKHHLEPSDNWFVYLGSKCKPLVRQARGNKKYKIYPLRHSGKTVYFNLTYFICSGIINFLNGEIEGAGFKKYN
jgi:hypothetical protein